MLPSPLSQLRSLTFRLEPSPTSGLSSFGPLAPHQTYQLKPVPPSFAGGVGVPEPTIRLASLILGLLGMAL